MLAFHYSIIQSKTWSKTRSQIGRKPTANLSDTCFFLQSCVSHDPETRPIFRNIQDEDDVIEACTALQSPCHCGAWSAGKKQQRLHVSDSLSTTMSERRDGNFFQTCNLLISALKFSTCRSDKDPSRTYYFLLVTHMTYSVSRTVSQKNGDIGRKAQKWLPVQTPPILSAGITQNNRPTAWYTYTWYREAVFSS